MFVRPEIAAMKGYVPGEQPQGGTFIKLNTNENPYPCSPAVGQAIHAALERGLSKYPDPQATSFRQAAAAVYGVTPEMILCGNGSDDILTIVTRAFVGTGELLRLPYPSYILYKTLAQLQGALAEEIPFAADWSLTPAFAAATKNLKLVFLPNPNSPTGTLISREAILQLADSLPCPVLIDEAYGDFAQWNAIDLVRQNPKIMVSRTLSKSYALAGLRFGYIIAQPQIIRELEKVKDSYNCDALSIAGATAAISDQAWLKQNTAQVVATRERLTKSLRQLGFSALSSEANFVWCTHPAQAAQPLYTALKNERVLVRYMNYAGWSDGLRISVGTDEQIDVLLKLLAQLVK
ncbi:MAG TPA: histidinol-phosphate transaminase [Pirellulaceae bacterium]|nr:histidinol-phosphate transaminase [Pirellulaceae bacterium]